jgi:outer membrane protein
VKNKKFDSLLTCLGIVFLLFPALASEIEGVRGDAPGQPAAPVSSDEDDYDKVIGPSLEIDVPPPPPSAHHAGVGAQVLIQSNPYRGGDTVTLALPMLTYVGERFFVVSPRAGFNILRNPRGSINVIADFRFRGESFENKGFLAGMDDRKNTAMAGLDGGIRTYARCRLDLSAMTDVLDRHNGQEVNLALSRVFRWEQLSLIPGAGLVWRSADYNDYYYGVAASEVTDERPAYDPGDSLEWFARVLLRYDLNESWSLAGAVRLEALSSEVRDSPIIDSDYVTTSIFGLNYFF